MPKGSQNHPCWDQQNSGRCRAEAEWICARPEFEASDRLKRLLLYLSTHSDSQGNRAVTQLDIAHEVMNLGPDFDPSNDAHVRIEVARLRTALAAFYSRLSAHRPHRLAIPKGCYETNLTTVPTEFEFDTQRDESFDPVIALGFLCTSDFPSQKHAFELECDLLGLVSTSDFVKDQLLVLSYVSGASFEGLVNQAIRIDADLLVVVHVSVLETGTFVWMSVVRPRDQRILSVVRLRDRLEHVNGVADVRQTSRDIATEILDPIWGCVLKHVFLLRPDTRIYQLSKVFNFMYSQSRLLLPAALKAAQEIAKTSATGKALSIDMTRASYCFATDPSIQDVSGSVEHAEALADKEAGSVWASLALGYAGVSCARADVSERAIATLETLPVMGAQGEDLALLTALTNGASESERPKFSAGSRVDLSVLDTIRAGIAALNDSEDSWASEVLMNSKHKGVFWLQTFQISSLVQRGEHEKARDTHQLMRQIHPGIDDYADRAVTTMIPDNEIKGRILAGLRRASA